MSQNRIALQLDVDRLNSLDAIITALEGQLTDLIGLDTTMAVAESPPG